MAEVLYVMVKDEENTIEKTLNSAKNYFNKLVIYDTGSTDKTIKKVCDWADSNNKKIHLLNGEFVDFATSRNVGLKFAENFCKEGDFIMILDSNDELVVNTDLTKELSLVPKEINGTMVNSYWEFSIEKNMMSHIKFLFVRAHKNVRYRGRVHEFLMNNDKQFDSYYFIQNVQLKQDRLTDDAKTKKRFERDVQFLLQDLKDCLDAKESPGRIYYYLGKTCMLLNRIDEAVKYLKLRTKIKDGDEEERHMVHMYLGLIFSQLSQATLPNVNSVLLKNHAKRLSEKSLKHYLEAYNVQPHVEPLIYIVKYYIGLKDWQSAYLYANCSLYIKLPTHSHTFNIKVYKFTRFLLMAEICFNLNKFDEGVSALDALDEIISVSNGIVNMPSYITQEEFENFQKIKNMYRMHAVTPVEGHGLTKAIVVHNDVKESTEKILLIACGSYWHKWDGNLMNSHRGIGGSELVAIKMAEFVAKQPGWRVVFCCDSEKSSSINGVEYIPLHKYEGFIQANIIEVLYIYRLANMTRYSNVRNLYISMEDVSFGGELVLKIGVMKKLICKSPWQKDIHCLSHPGLAPFLSVIGNGIDPARFLPGRDEEILANKCKNRFIYSSCPTRGLRGALDIFKEVSKFAPDAEFHVFIDREIIDYGPNTQMVKSICEELANTKGVVLNPKVSQQRLAEEALKAEYWLYPCTFTETYCITAQEMQAAGVLCIYRPLAALSTTVGDRGFPIESSFEGMVCTNIEPYVKLMKELICNPSMAEIKNTKFKMGREWALSQTWDKVNGEIFDMISGKPLVQDSFGKALNLEVGRL